MKKLSGDSRSGWIAFFGSLTLVSGWAETSFALDQVEIPCIQANDPQKFARLRASGRHAGQRSCSDVRPELLKKLEDRVRQQADCYYQGRQLNPLATAARPGECPGNPIPKESCNVLTNGVPGTFNGGGQELDKNHFGSSCGDWPYFKASMSGLTCNVTPDYTRTTHFIEDAYNRGAWIQSLNCFHNQVMLEIQNHGIVKISQIQVPDGRGGTTAQNGPCAVLQKDYLDAANQAVATGTSVLASQGVSGHLGSEINLSDIESCKGTEHANINEVNPDVGRLRQSACHLMAARSALETMFIHVAACEVWTRAGRAYDQFVGSTVGKDQVTAQVRKNINGVQSYDSGLCSHSRILNEYYKPQYYNVFKAKGDSIWNSNSCGDTGPGNPVPQE